MKDRILKFLEDIKSSIEIIEQHINGIETLEQYKRDIKTIDSVERRLAIIGEALHQIDKIDKSVVVSDKSKIIALRHILVHEYDLIDDATIWLILQKKLPLLKEEILKLLNY